MWKRLLAYLTFAAVGVILYRMFLAWRVEVLKSRLMTEIREAEARLVTAESKLPLIAAQKDAKVVAVKAALERAEVQVELLKDAKEWAQINEIAGIR
jgi:hypothetical protein